MKTVAFVPIRLNSKRVEGKNLRMLAGKPLLQYILYTLTQVANIDEVYCFCSAPEVRNFLPQGVKWMQRELSLDSDSTLGKDIYNSFVGKVDADVYVLAHATSPFIKASTIAAAVGKVQSGEYDSAFSAERIQTFAWFGGRPLNYDLKHVPRTQDIEPVFVETSAFYVFGREVWTRLGQRIGQHPFVSVLDRIEGVDIDWPEDFDFAERIVTMRGMKVMNDEC